MLIPEVNAHSLFDVTHADHQANRERVKEAVEHVGFMTLTNTAIGEQSVKQLIDIYHQFFLLPEGYKKEFDMSKTRSNRGWGAPGSEQVDPLSNPDFKQVFDCGFELDTGDPLAKHTYYAPNHWPEQPKEFAPVVNDYYQQAVALSRSLLSVIASTVGQPQTYFNDKFDKPMALLRGNYYPPRPASASSKDFGIAPHTDYGCLTLLAMDGSPGLEVQSRDKQWIPLAVDPGTFVINFGEMIQVWTGGRVIATPHRVVGSNAERISVPFFFNPRFDANVALWNSGDTLLAGDYLTRRYDETYVHRQLK